jgi:YVTN family beta-propeller protein
LASTAVAVSGFALTDRPGPAGKGATVLHNGWKITPAGADHQDFGDMLLGATVSPDGRWLAFVNGGSSAHEVHIADAATGKAISSAPVARAQASGGIAWAPDGRRLYVSGANAGRVYAFAVGAGGALTETDPLVIPNLTTDLKGEARPDPGKDAGRDPAKQDAPADDAFLSGVAVSKDGATLYVANLAGDSVYSLDSATGALKTVRKLEGKDRPGVVRVSPDGGTVYVALWGRAAVLALDPATLATRATLTVGSHPNDLLFTRDGARLFVSCGNEDSVHVLDTAGGKTQEKVSMRLTPRAPAGATPSALALSPDQKTLYVANADNNDVAVVDVGTPCHSRVEGFLPTTWYPSTVAVSPDGKRLFIGSGKGTGTGPNADTEKIDPVAPKGYPYIMQRLKGVLSTVEVPDAKQLAAYTKQVYANSPYTGDSLLDAPAKAPKPGTNAIPSKVGDPSPIKHVLYIIKENRTYDQVFGDMTDARGKRIGNGDPNLTLFGEEVTPNHHALAREFVLLDNLYASGEVSADGHHWSNGAYVPDAMQRTWQAQYGGKGAPPIRYGDFGDPLAETPAGRIWDLCARANVPFRTYYYHTDKNRSDAWAKARADRKRDYEAADLFVQDVQGWDRSGRDMPRFMVMALSEDHTSGTRPGTFTPRAAVASNDLGVGKIVEAISKSRFWKDTAIFIVEDDAQNGPDHVDAHRTVALVVSPYTRRGAVDGTMYSTCSLLRTMELILGLPPMSQYDAAATPLYASFTSKPDLTPYTARPARIDLNAKNTQAAYGAKASLALDLSAPDRLTRADEDTLNRVLWHSVKGAKTPYPGIVRRPLFDRHGRPATTAPGKKEAEEEEDED